ncbi:MAG: hypothetical protein ACO38I_09805 [Ilumatobacteraceae bacterium]
MDSTPSAVATTKKRGPGEEGEEKLRGEYTVLGVDVGLKNLALCALKVSDRETPKKRKKDGSKDVRGVLFWETIDCTRGAGDSGVRAAPPIARQVELVVAALGAAAIPGGLREVIIEAQPAGSRGGNTVMKCLQHAIQVWFMCRSDARVVRMVPAACKLGRGAPASYAARKKLAVTIARGAVSDLAAANATCVLTDRWVRKLGDSKKADDLADSFLLAWRG